MSLDMNQLVEAFLTCKRFAVVGSFKDAERFAYKILISLMSRGYEVYPVNPRLSEVAGLPCYKSILDIPVTVDVADIVTPPDITALVLKDCLQKGVRRIWLQPGAESPAAIQFCEDNHMAVAHGMCVMLEAMK